jgi:hypothetical protein
MKIIVSEALSGITPNREEHDHQARELAGANVKRPSARFIRSE